MKTLSKETLYPLCRLMVIREAVLRILLLLAVAVTVTYGIIQAELLQGALVIVWVFVIVSLVFILSRFLEALELVKKAVKEDNLLFWRGSCRVVQKGKYAKDWVYSIPPSYTVTYSSHGTGPQNNYVIGQASAGYGREYWLLVIGGDIKAAFPVKTYTLDDELRQILCSPTDAGYMTR